MTAVGGTSSSLETRTQETCPARWAREESAQQRGRVEVARPLDGHSVAEHEAIDNRPFDLVGERIQVSREQVASSTYRESYLITLANHKEEAVLISVVEHPGGSSWEILSSSEGYEKVDSDTICFSMNVPAGEKKEVSYTVEYRY